jgi:hypothetical protein
MKHYDNYATTWLTPSPTEYTTGVKSQEQTYQATHTQPYTTTTIP